VYEVKESENTMEVVRGLMKEIQDALVVKSVFTSFAMDLCSLRQLTAI
jgi:hypothetical protein